MEGRGGGRADVAVAGVVGYERRQVANLVSEIRFVEHGHAPDAGVARWQERPEPLNKRLAGGCHLTRRMPDAIKDAGFVIDRLESYYFVSEPKVFGFTSDGRAAKL